MEQMMEDMPSGASRPPAEAPRERDYLLPASIIIAALLIAGSIVYLVGSRKYANPQTQQAAVSPIVGGATSTSVMDLRERDVILGDPEAPVTVIEYGDYQCMFCGKFFDLVEIPLREDYIKPGKVRMVFRNFQFLGPESNAAGEAAECAKDQKQFWAFHDEIFREEIKDGRANNGNLNRDLFVSIAKRLKLDESAFISCMDGKKYADQVRKDTAEGQSLGVNSTPTTFVNGKAVLGVKPSGAYEEFKAIVDSFLTKI